MYDSDSKYYDFNVRQAETLADLDGVRVDLERVVRSLDRILAELAAIEARSPLLSEPSSSPDGLSHELSLIQRTKSSSEIEALEDVFNAALVRYARSFVSGVRAPGVKTALMAWRVGLSQDLRNAHDYFRDVRDKYVAHVVNAFEENHVLVALLDNPLTVPQVKGVIVQHGYMGFAFNAGAVQTLRTLAKSAIEFVAEAVERERSEVLEYANTLPRQEIEARGMEAPPLPHPSQVRERRPPLR